MNILSFFRKITALMTISIFLSTSILPYNNAWATDELNNSVVTLSKVFNPVLLKGVKVNPKKPFEFQFVIDAGDLPDNDSTIADEAQKSIDYFLTSITVPGEDLWVNLSPLEPDRIIPDKFGSTAMGRDLLSQDYLLKQITSKLMSPDDSVGQQFWDKVYEAAEKRYGTRDIPVDMASRVWIIPGQADVYVENGTAYVVEAKLKVMLEHDYEVLQGLSGTTKTSPHEFTEESNQILRDIVIPMIEKEVNQGHNFAHTRQVYHSLILAKWYKETLKKSILTAVYADQSKVQGVTFDSGFNKDDIYQQYVKGFESGVYNSTKEEYDPIKQEIVAKKYFVGGVNLEEINVQQKSSDKAQIIDSFKGKILVLSAAFLLSSTTSALADNARLGRNARTPVIVTSTQATNNTKTFTFDSNTGFTETHRTDVSGVGSYGSSTYAMAIGTLVAPEGSKAFKNAYLSERTFGGFIRGNVSTRYPKTNDTDHSPKGGVYSLIKTRQGSVRNWDYNPRTGDNAWLGISSLFHYLKTKDKDFLKYAMKRAEFLKKLEDVDGVLRHGPQAGTNLNLWNAKSTEDNQTAFRFFEILYEVTGREEYKETADNLYNWIMDEMYDAERNLFKRGSSYRARRWVADDVGEITNGASTFNISTITNMPMSRMLEDSRLGDTPESRILKIGRMLLNVDERLAIENANGLIGYAETAFAKREKVVDVEQSYLLAEKYLKVATALEGMGKELSANIYRRKYNLILTSMDKYVQINFNRTETVPEHVYLDPMDLSKQRSSAEVRKFIDRYSVGWSPARNVLSTTVIKDLVEQGIDIKGMDLFYDLLGKRPRGDGAMFIEQNKNNPTNNTTLTEIKTADSVVDNKTGGIDFTDNIFNINVSGSAGMNCSETEDGCFEFNISAEELKSLREDVNGFEPVIIDIHSVKQIPFLS